jgi:pimeloyl-ACP methyl ester carboxylesterase
VRGGAVEGSGHWIPEEKPEWTLRQLLDFFGEERG